MGLDMYLTANVFVPRTHELPTEHKLKLALQEAFGTDEYDRYGSDTSYSTDYIILRVGYWRKANTIHQWFVENVQGGEDDCHKYDVGDDDLLRLRGLCEGTLVNRKLIQDGDIEPLLPPQEGFFIGGTNLDEWYFGDMEKTIEIIDKLRSHPHYKLFKVQYRSSW